MRHLLLLLFIVLSHLVQAQEVTLDNIATFEGKIVTLCSTITGTYQTKGEKKVTYLNFGKLYPNSSFTIVIFEKELIHFSYNPAAFLKNKKVCVTGKVVLYKRKPQFIISKEAEIVVEK